MTDFAITLPLFPNRIHIANVLSKAENLKAHPIESLRLPDGFLKAGQFVSTYDIQPEFSEELYPRYGGNGPRSHVNTYTYDGNFVLICRQCALCSYVKLVKRQFNAAEHAS